MFKFGRQTTCEIPMNYKTLSAIGGLLVGMGCGMALKSRRQRKQFSFRGRAVVITGGSRGLGLVMARQLAAEHARLCLLARNASELERAESELRARGAEVLAIPCDVRRQAEVDEAIRRAADRFGTIDVLINNAGIIQVAPVEH